MAGYWPEGDRRRSDIIAFIGKYWANFGFAPSVQEITEGVGLQSKTAVRHHLVILKQRGLIVSQEGKYRSIRLVEQPAVA